MCLVSHSIDVTVGRVGLQVVADALMSNHHSLGSACRAAGIDEIHKVVCRQFHIRVFGASRGIVGYQFIHEDSLPLVFCHMVGSGYDVGSFGILCDEADAVGRICRVARYVSRSRLAYTVERE